MNPFGTRSFAHDTLSQSRPRARADDVLLPASSTMPANTSQHGNARPPFPSAQRSKLAGISASHPYNGPRSNRAPRPRHSALGAVWNTSSIEAHGVTVISSDEEDTGKVVLEPLASTIQPAESPDPIQLKSFPSTSTLGGRRARAASSEDDPPMDSGERIPTDGECEGVLVGDSEATARMKEKARERKRPRLHSPDNIAFSTPSRIPVVESDWTRQQNLPEPDLNAVVSEEDDPISQFSEEPPDARKRSSKDSK
jgi:hypothetical protein